MNICLSTGKEITFDLDYDSIEKRIERYEHFLNELIMESFHKSEKSQETSKMLLEATVDNITQEAAFIVENEIKDPSQFLKVILSVAGVREFYSGMKEQLIKEGVELD